jgi:hypothetical protein
LFKDFEARYKKIKLGFIAIVLEDVERLREP